MLKKKNSTIILIIILFILVFKISNLYADLECYILIPPEKIIDNVKKIAVLDFDSKDGKGKAFADYVISYLLMEDRGIEDLKGFFSSKEGKTFLVGATTNIYQIIERSQLERVLNEQGLGLSGLIDDNQAAELGKILGLDAIILGSISFNSNDKNVTETYTNYDTKQKYNVYCTIRTVTTEVRMKIISVDTGEILGNKNSKQSYQDKKCDEERSGLLSESQLVDYCLRDIAYWMVNYFSPKFSYVKYDFETIKMKDFKKQAKEAKKLVKKGYIDEAFPIYNAIYEADPYNPKAAFNLAHLHQAVGNCNKAYDLYAEAYDIDSKNKKYQNAYIGAKALKEFVDVLIDIGVSFEEYVFSIKDDALAEKIKIKGGTTDRIKVMSEQDINSQIIAKVPGGLEFTVIEKSGDWYLIKLKGNKQGYVHKSKVK